MRQAILTFNTLNQIQTSTPEPKGKAVRWLTKRLIQEQEKLLSSGMRRRLVCWMSADKELAKQATSRKQSPVITSKPNT